MSKIGWRSAKGSIALISMLFVGSAAVRLMTGAEAALASTDEPQIDSQTEEQVITQPNVEPKKDVGRLARELTKREERVRQLEFDLAVKERSIEVAKQEVERRIIALEDMENRLRATLAKADQAAEKDIARLTSVYENMKPAQAAPLFEAMEPSFAAGFLSRMRPDAAAGILANVDPQAAYTISVLIAGQNASVPKN